MRTETERVAARDVTQPFNGKRHQRSALTHTKLRERTAGLNMRLTRAWRISARRSTETTTLAKEAYIGPPQVYIQRVQICQETLVEFAERLVELCRALRD